jgi:outer membrane lipoprotein
MTPHKFNKWFLVSLCVFAASGCAYPISKELRQEAGKNLTFSMVFQNPAAYVGSIVIWGGEIIRTTNLKNSTEILILDTPLDYQGMPESAELSRGRFIVKSPQFLDPALYKKGRKLTVAGEVIGKETRELGQTEYTYPVIMAKEVHIWKGTQYMPYYIAPYWWGWYGPGLYYGPYYGGFYGDLGGDEEEDEEGERGDRDRD